MYFIIWYASMHRRMLENIQHKVEKTLALSCYILLDVSYINH